MLKDMRRSKAEYKSLFLLMFPMILQFVATASLGLADTFMVGLIGQNELAGLSQANTVFFVLQLFGFGVQSGGSVLMGQYWGKRDMGAINRVMGMGLYTSFVIGVVLTTIIFLFPREVMSLTTNDPVLIDCAARYGRIVAYSYLLSGLSAVYLGACVSVENSKIGMAVLTSSGVINIFLNWVLIFGRLGAPKLGLEGAAYATLISRILEFTAIFIYAVFIDKRIKLMPEKIFKPGKIIFKDYIKYCTPALINEVLWGIGYSMYAVIYGHMRGASDIVAAYSIVGNIERLILVVSSAVGNSGAVVVSKTVGAGKSREEVQSVANWILGIAIISGIVSSAVSLCMLPILEPVIFKVFTVSEAAKKIVVIMILFSVIRLISKSYNYSSIVGVLRGGGNVKIAMKLDVMFMYCFSIPACAIAAFLFDASITVVYLLAVSEEAAKAVVGHLIIRKGDWMRNLTRENI